MCQKNSSIAGLNITKSALYKVFQLSVMCDVIKCSKIMFNVYIGNIPAHVECYGGMSRKHSCTSGLWMDV